MDDDDDVDEGQYGEEEEEGTSCSNRVWLVSCTFPIVSSRILWTLEWANPNNKPTQKLSGLVPTDSNPNSHLL